MCGMEKIAHARERTEAIVNGRSANKPWGTHSGSAPSASRRSRMRSIDFPQAGRSQFQQMPVGVSEIDAVPSARPAGAALYFNIEAVEARLPLGQLLRRDGKCHVQWAAAIVWGNGAAAHSCRFERRAASENQQHVTASNRKRTHPVIPDEQRQAKNIRVKTVRTVEVIHIQRCF